jgi:hypothetical protein
MVTKQLHFSLLAVCILGMPLTCSLIFTLTLTLTLLACVSQGCGKNEGCSGCHS